MTSKIGWPSTFWIFIPQKAEVIAFGPSGCCEFGSPFKQPVLNLGFKMVSSFKLDSQISLLLLPSLLFLNLFYMLGPVNLCFRTLLGYFILCISSHSDFTPCLFFFLFFFYAGTHSNLFLLLNCSFAAFLVPSFIEFWISPDSLLCVKKQVLGKLWHAGFWSLQSDPFLSEK